MGGKKTNNNCRLEIYFAWDPDQVSRIPITTGGSEEMAVSKRRSVISQALDLKKLDMIFST